MSSASDPLQGYAVHFTRGVSAEDAAKARAQRPTKPSLGDLLRWLDSIDDTGFRTSLSILGSGFIRPTSYPMGVGETVPELADAHRSACFSESPLDDLARLIETRSLYGVGFRQSFLQQRGGDRVIYVPDDSAEAGSWRQHVAARRSAGVDPGDGFWMKTPFVDLLSPSNDTTWEKEWRVPGGLSFEPEDVAFVFLPEDLHEKARRFFTDHQRENTGPAYLGRYLDPRWDRARIEAVLAAPVAPVAPEPASAWTPPPNPLARGH
jgi:hypothetical protein